MSNEILSVFINTQMIPVTVCPVPYLESFKYFIVVQKLLATLQVNIGINLLSKTIEIINAVTNLLVPVVIILGLFYQKPIFDWLSYTLMSIRK